MTERRKGTGKKRKRKKGAEVVLSKRTIKKEELKIKFLKWVNAKNKKIKN
jgi:hypothetical protein